MDDANPYRSPVQGSEANGEFQPRFDAGRLTARYLQMLAVLGIVSMVVSLLFFDRFIFDFSWLLALWAAHHLLKRSPTARTWVIVICVFNLVMMALFLVLVILNQIGLISLSYRGSGVIDSRVFPAVVFFTLVILVSIPVWLLNTEEAKREFLEN